jgi:hypothetical protein
MREPCAWAEMPGSEMAPQPTMPVVVNAAPKKTSSSVPPVERRVADKINGWVGDAMREGAEAATCPVCAARREKAREYMRAYRKERG